MARWLASVRASLTSAAVALCIAGVDSERLT
jgi:hypothetical protein